MRDIKAGICVASLNVQRADISSDYTPPAKTEAEKLQQRAERRKGLEAASLYEQAVALYREAVHADTGGTQDLELYFNTAESLQNWAEALLDAAQSMPDESVKQATLVAKEQAYALFNQAVDSYKRVVDSDGSLRCDAAVNCGNTLARIADLVASNKNSDLAIKLLQQACLQYNDALRKEEDALTLNNKGDALIGLAVLLVTKDNKQADKVFDEANKAYTQSCSLSTSENGDDLPSLLLNWGAGLLSYAQSIISEDGARALHLLEQAELRLKRSIEFDRADVAPLNALGETLLLKAEVSNDESSAAAAQDQYRAALRINGKDAEALLGLADTYMLFGKIGNDVGCYQEALRLCEMALQDTKRIGGFEERSDARYNHACCLNKCARWQEAASALRLLHTQGGLHVEEFKTDPDLYPCNSPTQGDIMKYILG